MVSARYPVIRQEPLVQSCLASFFRGRIILDCIKVQCAIPTTMEQKRHYFLPLQAKEFIQRSPPPPYNCKVRLASRRANHYNSQSTYSCGQGNPANQTVCHLATINNIAFQARSFSSVSWCDHAANYLVQT